MANLVPGEGKLSSKLWLIGEAPGANEDRVGRPFVGGAGMVLDGILAEADIKRGECYIDNVIQYQPPSNNFGIYYNDAKRENPTGGLLEAHERLRRLVRENRPNVVVALGNEALYALLGKRAVTKWRGSILACEGVKVIPTIHPAMIMREYKFRPQALFDLCKAKKESLTPNFPPLPVDELIVAPSFDNVMQHFELLNKQPYIAFDIETAMDIHQILCIAFAWHPNKAISIPIFHQDHSFWTPEQELGIIRELRRLFTNKNIKFIAQNAQFDMSYIKRQWDIDIDVWLDTMIAHHCVYPELPKGLGFLVSVYTNYPYHKDIAEHETLSDFWRYNCMDAARTYECAFEIKKEAEEFGTWNLYKSLSGNLIKPLFEMQTTGILIDVEKRKELDRNLEADLAHLQQRLDTAIGHPVNVSSPKQMCALLYEELKFPPVYRDRKDAKTGEKKKTITADDDALEELDRKFPGSIIFKLIQDIRSIQKLLSTYVRAELDPDNRIRCSYMITGTETGRLSSRANAYDTGTNLQNIPRGPLIRALFIADPGHFLVNADLSQAEARVVAYLAQDERLQTVFSQGGDVHKRNASIVFKKPAEQITEQERDLGKMLVHASNYGLGADKFARNIGVTKARAEELLNAYHANYPRIKRWHQEVEMELRRTRTLTTPLGRKRIFFGRINNDLAREGIAYVPQSTVGDLLNLGLIRAYNNLPPGWRIILQVHDSVMFQVPDETPPMHIYKFIHHYFEIPLTIHGKTFTIPVDIKVGKNWGELKKLEL